MEPNEIRIERTILKFDVKNLNDRIYPRETFEKALAEYNEKIKAKQSLGQCMGDVSHPDQIDMGKISHLVENIKLDGDIAIANIKILDSHMGNTLKDVLDSVVFRPRSIGTVDSKGVVTISKLISFDAILKDNDSFKGLIDE